MSAGLARPLPIELPALRRIYRSHLTFFCQVQHLEPPKGKAALLVSSVLQGAFLCPDMLGVCFVEKLDMLAKVATLSSDLCCLIIPVCSCVCSCVFMCVFTHMQ